MASLYTMWKERGRKEGSSYYVREGRYGVGRCGRGDHGVGRGRVEHEVRLG